MNNIKINKKKGNPRIEFWVSLKPRMTIKIWDGIVPKKKMTGKGTQISSST